MNYTSDELQDIVFLNKPLNYITNSKIIDDLIFLQEKLYPLGILNNINIDDLYDHSTKTLILLHKWQNDLFAMKYFKECSRNPPSQNIFGVYV